MAYHSPKTSHNFRGSFGSSKKRKNKLNTGDESDVEDMVATPPPSPEDDLEASKSVCT
jgi:hypothetical protein